jgi:hypothetical protein
VIRASRKLGIKLDIEDARTAIEGKYQGQTLDTRKFV